MRRWSNQEVSFSCMPYGNGQDDEGVALLLEIGEYRILLDCGLDDLSDLCKNPAVDLVLCSHAHRDHAGGLLSFHQIWPDVPIFASGVTAYLLTLLWPAITYETINRFCHEIPWRSPVKVLENLTVELFPAGHIPGAASFLLTYQTKGRSYRIFYTGDFCLSNFQLVEGLSIEPLRGLNPDILILEGTYGTNRHPHRRQQEKTLMELIHNSLCIGQNIAFLVDTLGLGQEILKLLRSHHQFTGRQLDIWVTGQLAVACDIYLQLLPQFPIAVQNFAKHQPLFWDERVFPKMHRISPENQPNNSPYILLCDDPSTILQYCDQSWLVLIPEHKKNLAQIFTDLHCVQYLLAEHSDGRNTTQLIHNLRPQHVILIHGPANYLKDLAALEELQNRYQLHVPSRLHQVDLPIGEKFVQPVLSTFNLYEGELNEFGSSIVISLPNLISNDTRWSVFSGTGIVEARWQGDELVIRGLPERELILHNNENNKRTEDIDCCRNCRHYRGQKCWNTKSPLYDFKVTPEGCCPVFETITILQE